MPKFEPDAEIGQKGALCKGLGTDAELRDLSAPDIVILDMIMPEMGGAETYAEIKKRKPGMKVLLASGYSMDGEARGILEKGCDGFIKKPFTIHEISCKIRRILEG